MNPTFNHPENPSKQPFVAGNFKPRATQTPAGKKTVPSQPPPKKDCSVFSRWKKDWTRFNFPEFLFVFCDMRDQYIFIFNLD
jgi:hypothetical protein